MQRAGTVKLMDSSFIGKVVDHYRIIENLGIGGMGVVFKAINININKLVALKMIAPGLAMNPNFIKRFQTEAKALAKLNDFNIVGITDLRKDNDQWFIVMEYVDGANLYDKIKRDGPYTCSASIPIIKQILRAIGHAHKAGIIHRDLKPNNIMITKDDVVKITDFGLAKDQSLGSSVVSIASGGTLFYMSPEHVKGFSFTDHRSDLYSIGMTYYEMITGKVPFQNINSDFDLRERIIRKNFEKPSVFNPKIPPGLEAIIMKSIAKDPEMRYQTANEMLAAIERFEKTYETGQFPKFSKQPATAAEAEDFSVEAEQDSETTGSNKKLWWLGLALVVLVSAILLLPGLLNHQAQLLVPETATEDSLVRSAPDTIKPEVQPAQQPVQQSAPPQTNVKPVVNLARLSIRSNPSGAQVKLDGRERGRTPVEITGLPPGRYALQLFKPGYELFVKDLQLKAGNNPLGLIRLSQSGGSLRLQNLPVGAVAKLDDELLEQPEMSGLKPGLHQLMVSRDGYEPFRSSIQIKPGEESLVQVTLQPIQVQLTVQVKPWGSIYIDNQLKQADTDLEFTTTLAPGAHTLRVVHPTLGIWQREQNWTKSGTEVVKVDFTQTRALRVNAVDENNRPLQAAIIIDGVNTEHRTPDPVLARIGRRKIQVKLDGYRVVTEAQEIMLDDRFYDELTFILQKQ